MHAMFAIALMLAAVIATRGVVESLPHLRGGAYGGAGVAILGHAKLAPTASPTSVTTTTPKPKPKPKVGFKIYQSNPPAANGVYRLRGSKPPPHGRSLLARHTNTNTASTTTEETALFAFDEATKETQGQMFSPGELGLLLTGFLPQVPTGAGQGIWVTSAWENGDKNNNGEIDRTEFVSLIRGMLASKLPQRRLLARLNPKAQNKAQPKGPPPKLKAKAKAKPKAQPVNDAPNPTNADDKVVDLNDDNLRFDDDDKWLYGDDTFFPKRDDGPLGGGGKEVLDPPMTPHELATMRISISLLANKLVSLDTDHDGNLHSNAVSIETMPQTSAIVVRFLAGDQHSAFVTSKVAPSDPNPNPNPNLNPSLSLSPSPSSGATGTLALGNIILNLFEADTDNDGLLSFSEFKFALDTGHRGRYLGANGPRGGARVPAVSDVRGVVASADAAMVMVVLAFVELEVLSGALVLPRSSTLLPAAPAPAPAPALAPAPAPGSEANLESGRNTVPEPAEFVDDGSIAPLPLPPSDDSPNTYYGYGSGSYPVEGGHQGVGARTRGLDGTGAGDDDKSKDISAIIPNPVFADPVAFPVPPREYAPALPVEGGPNSPNPDQEGKGPKKPSFWPQAPQKQGDVTTTDTFNDGGGGSKYDPEIAGLAAAVGVLGAGLVFLVPIWVWARSVEHKRQEVLEKQEQEQEVYGFSGLEGGGGAAEPGVGGKVGSYWLDFSGSLDSVRSPLQLKAGRSGAGAAFGGSGLVTDSIPALAHSVPLTGPSSLQMLSLKPDRAGAGDDAATGACGTASPASGRQCRQYTSSGHQYLTVASTSTHVHMSDMDAAASAADAYLV